MNFNSISLNVVNIYLIIKLLLKDYLNLFMILFKEIVVSFKDEIYLIIIID